MYRHLARYQVLVHVLTCSSRILVSTAAVAHRIHTGYSSYQVGSLVHARATRSKPTSNTARIVISRCRLQNLHPARFTSSCIPATRPNEVSIWRAGAGIPPPLQFQASPRAELNAGCDAAMRCARARCCIRIRLRSQARRDLARGAQHAISAG